MTRSAGSLAPWLLLILAGAAAPPAARASPPPAADPELQRALNLEPNAHLQHLATISDADGSLARTYLSPAHKRAAAQILRWMEDAGMEAWVDAVGNVHGRVNATAPGAPAVLVGSHYDTVLDGGAYDGALGILVGIAAVKGLLLQQLKAAGQLGRAQLLGGDKSDISIPREVASTLLARASLHVVAFADEEGVRFQSTFLGSRAVAGTLLKYNMLASRDKAGASLEEVLASEGGVADPRAAVAGLALDPGSVSEYVEVHMEQGPVLEALGLPLGVVSAIAGQSRLWVDVAGVQGHAGTVPMKGRRDSLAAAAELIVGVEALCTRPPEQGGPSEEENLVCTVGEVKVWPGASNVIAGSVGFSLDVRAKGDALRAATVAALLEMVEAVCGRRGVACAVRRTHDAAAVLADAGVMRGMVEAAQGAGVLLASSLTPEQAAASDVVRGLREAPVLVSGAGHDAMAIAEVVPKMGMMFVRCRGGVSHSPLEHVEPVDVAASAAALASYLRSRTVDDPRVRDEL